MKKIVSKREFVQFVSSLTNLNRLSTTLSSLLAPSRLARFDQVLHNRINSVHVAFESPSNVHNVISCLRTAEALGVFNFHFISFFPSTNPSPSSYLTSNESMKTGILNKISSGSFHWISCESYSSFLEFSTSFRTNYPTYRLIGAVPKESNETDSTEQFPTSLFGHNENDFDSTHQNPLGSKHHVDLDEIPLLEPICLLFGNESRGLTQEAIQGCSQLFNIPMYGFTVSYNLSVSTGISLYETLQRKRRLLKQTGDFTQRELEIEKLWLIYSSVGRNSGATIVNNICEKEFPLEWEKIVNREDENQLKEKDEIQ